MFSVVCQLEEVFFVSPFYLGVEVEETGDGNGFSSTFLQAAFQLPAQRLWVSARHILACSLSMPTEADPILLAPDDRPAIVLSYISWVLGNVAEPPSIKFTPASDMFPLDTLTAVLKKVVAIPVSILSTLSLVAFVEETVVRPSSSPVPGIFMMMGESTYR